MEKTELNKIYKTKILPRKIFGTINAILCFFFAFFFFAMSITRCASGKYVGNLSLNVAQVPLNEYSGDSSAPAPSTQSQQPQDEFQGQQNQDDSQLRSGSDGDSFKSISLDIQTYHVASSNPQATRSNAAWNHAFNIYAKKVVINDPDSTYQFNFRIGGFPLNHRSPSYAEIAFEVYNKDKDYLFTFYADNYWNQSGYDDGYWHESNYIESVTINFPQKGEYYLVAGIPKGRYNRITYNIVQQYSDGQIRVTIIGGIKPVSVFSMIVALIFFIFAGIVLTFIRHGESNRYQLIAGNINFNKNDYIVKMPKEVSEDLFHVVGFSRKRGYTNSIELILQQDNVNSFLEIERDTVDVGDSTKTVFNHYYYEKFPEDDFTEIPVNIHINYKGKSYRINENKKTFHIDTFYNNGLKESAKKITTNYCTNNYSDCLSFEYVDDEKDFDISYGVFLKPVRIWGVSKK